MLNSVEAIAHPDDLPQELLDLIEALNRLPEEQRQSLAPLIRRVADGTKRRRRIVHLVQESLSQLRLDMKYLVFDLEATRRERDHFRESLDKATRGWEPQDES